MNIVNILDCTLRDGGYCNNWNFGNKNIRKLQVEIEHFSNQ